MEPSDLVLEPPPERALEALDAASRAGACSLDALAALRARCAPDGLPLPRTGLDALCAEEPALRGALEARIVPALLRAAAAFPRDPLRRLVTGASATLALPRAHAAGLVAHMFLGTLPEPRTREARERTPHASFLLLHVREHPQELAKLRCVLAYFERLADEGPPPGALRLERHALASPRDLDAWCADPSPLVALDERASGRIEDARDAVHIDFANRFLGGGVLSGGCVQEEIRFAECPELLAAMPLCEVLAPHEALRLDGAEFYAHTTGYAFSLRYGGRARDDRPRDAAGAPRTALVAIDAMHFGRRSDRIAQLDEASLLRELEKARAGFTLARGEPIATGHWGCGAFGGYHPLKLVQQWLAASSAGAALRYYTFGDARAGALGPFVRAASARYRTTGALSAALRRVCREARAAQRPLDPPWLLDELLASP